MGLIDMKDCVKYRYVRFWMNEKQYFGGRGGGYLNGLFLYVNISNLDFKNKMRMKKKPRMERRTNTWLVHYGVCTCSDTQCDVSE